MPQLEKALAQKQRPNTARNLKINKLKKKKKANPVAYSEGLAFIFIIRK